MITSCSYSLGTALLTPMCSFHSGYAPHHFPSIPSCTGSLKQWNTPKPKQFGRTSLASPATMATWIKRILRGSPRIFSATPIRPHAEITKDVLPHIIRTVGHHYDDINILVAFTTAFAAFLRSRELSWDSWDPATSPLSLLSRRSVKIHGARRPTAPPQIKDRSIRHRSRHSAISLRDSCNPVRALQSLFERYPKPSTDPLSSTSCGPFNKKCRHWPHDIFWSLIPSWCSQRCRLSRNT
jgi:hypothetical protein